MAAGRRPARAGSKEKLLAVRIPESLMRALDDHAEALRGETPWVEMSRSDVVRWLLSRALEQELGKPQPSGGSRQEAAS